MISNNHMSQMVSEVSTEIARHQEARILEQLNDFVSRGLIKIEFGPTQFFRDQFSDKIQISQSVNLRLKDREYVEALEKEVAELRSLIAKIKGAI